MVRYVDVAWGEAGLRNAAECEVIVIVDVLSFTTAVDAGCSAGAIVYPYAWKDDRVVDYAREVGAKVAVQRQDGATSELPSLSPPSLKDLAAGTRIVLPSPNGSALSQLTQAPCVLAACLRNANAVASYLNQRSGHCTVIAAGERWDDNSLRPALEDWLGAGAVISSLRCEKSFDAICAQSSFKAIRDLEECLGGLQSGVELTERGFGADVEYAAQLNCSTTVPLLSDSAYRHAWENR